MHILHVIQLYHPAKSGAGRFFEEIGARLVAEGHQVTVLATDAHDLEHLWLAGRRRIDSPGELQRGVRVVRLPTQRMPGPPFVYPLLRRLMVEAGRVRHAAGVQRWLAQLTPRMRDLDEWLAHHGPFDLINGGNITLDFALLPALAYAQQRGVPFVCTPFVHLGEPGSNAMLRYYSMAHQIELLQASQRVITMTNLESAYLERRGVSGARLRRVGVGVDPADVAGGDQARFRSLHQIDGPLVLYIGAMARDKGAIDTIEAMRLVWEAGSTATLVMIGAPLAHFTAYFEALPDDVKRSIRLLPYAPDEVKRDALAAASLLAMPSRTDSFGIVFLEAWCYAMPVIGARAGGVPDVIRDGVDGLLVPYGDPAALAAAVQYLVQHPDDARGLGVAGQARVLREMTWDQVYKTARAVYAELINLGPRN